MIVGRENRGIRRTCTDSAAHAATVTVSTTPSRIHRPEPTVLSGTSQATLANAGEAVDGVARSFLVVPGKAGGTRTRVRRHTPGSARKIGDRLSG